MTARNLTARSLLLLACWSASSQVKGPFEVPGQFRRFQFPQRRVADCSLPFQHNVGSYNRLRRYSVGKMIVEIGSGIHVHGTDARGASWELDLDIRQGGCWLWRADLDRNGIEDLIMVTSDATSAGESWATLLLIDGHGRPVPWQAVGYFDPDDNGLRNLVDLEQDGHAELLYLHVEGYDRGNARATSLTRYKIRDASLRRVDGSYGGHSFPIIRPAGSKLKQEPDLTNAVKAGTKLLTIAAVLEGRKSNCGVQLPIVRRGGGEVAVDAKTADAQIGSCYDNVLLSDGSRFRLPEMVVLDRGTTREIALADSGRKDALLVDARKAHLRVHLAGQVCETECHPFMLWAAE